MSNLHKMSEADLYELYNTLSSLKTLKSPVADVIYTSLMTENKELILHLLQQAIVYEVAERIDGGAVYATNDKA